ncbi:hypothetical protein GC584_01530 [Corynebacterium sp. zg912]|uniref:Or membrane protein n=1 Tax=Corynebacterium wankanglinii TaxID=2735136 RepID=A0A7H0K8V6_9CORY|nr:MULTISPECIES: hypothetical protein [Corynebacterium]MBA1837159.1 hypothetical protein [Corynebacterium wankanglinii]MCR5928134.1 hypothetical protein [Corynebacterium sp. zg912]QNP93722.1 hypothetical protein IA203_07735 [Corynebacterium wankanglinii]
MRNFRKAALAGATAVAVAFGSTAVATAVEGAEDSKVAESTYVAPTRKIDADVDAAKDQEPGLSSKIAGSKTLGFQKDGELQGADGQAIFGKDNNLESQPVWAKVAFALTIFTSVSAVIGLIVGPLYNFIVHGPVNF